jgi:hypothetical protein
LGRQDSVRVQLIDLSHEQGTVYAIAIGIVAIIYLTKYTDGRMIETS